MSEVAIANVGENTPEQVAFKLMQVIANCENRSLNANIGNNADRKWVLSTYSQCLAAVHRVPIATVMAMHQES